MDHKLNKGIHLVITFSKPIFALTLNNRVHCTIIAIISLKCMSTLTLNPNPIFPVSSTRAPRPGRPKAPVAVGDPTGEEGFAGFRASGF